MSNLPYAASCKVSRSDRFEFWGGVVIEGDCVTRTCVRYFLVGIYETSEALLKAIDDDKHRSIEFEEVRLPSAYVARHKKIAQRKVEERKRLDESDPCPF